MNSQELGQKQKQYATTLVVRFRTPDGELHDVADVYETVAPDGAACLVLAAPQDSDRAAFSDKALVNEALAGGKSILPPHNTEAEFDGNGVCITPLDPETVRVTCTVPGFRAIALEEGVPGVAALPTAEVKAEPPGPPAPVDPRLTIPPLQAKADPLKAANDARAAKKKADAAAKAEEANKARDAGDTPAPGDKPAEEAIAGGGAASVSSEAKPAEGDKAAEGEQSAEASAPA